MSSSRSFTLVNHLDRVQRVLDAVQNDPELAALLATFNYDAAAIEHGRTLHEQVRSLQHARLRQHGEGSDAAVVVEEARRRAEDSYRMCVRVAKVALRHDRATLDGMGIKQFTKVGVATWIYDARRFYANVLSNPAVLQKLARFNISRERLEAARREVDDLEQAQHDREREQRHAQAATAARNEALEDLDRWMRDFVDIARMATAGRPELHAKLKVRGRS